MEFLKRNGVGLAAILCCCVLGVLWAQQNGQLQELRRENADLTARLDDAEKVEEPEVPAAPSAKILSSSVDPETRMLTLEVAAEVPGLEDYYADIGLCQPGEAYRMAWQWASLKQQADGTYAGTLTFPLDLDMGLELRQALPAPPRFQRHPAGSSGHRFLAADPEAAHSAVPKGHPEHSSREWPPGPCRSVSETPYPTSCIVFRCPASAGLPPAPE